MICFVLTSGSVVCDKLSRALWSLARPPHTRSNFDTSEMFSSLTCNDGSVWLQVDTTFDIPVHPEAELDGIADVLQPWVDEGALPADTIPNLAAFVESKRGQRLIVWEAFPQLFKDQSKTREELVALGILAPLQP